MHTYLYNFLSISIPIYIGTTRIIIKFSTTITSGWLHARHRIYYIIIIIGTILSPVLYKYQYRRSCLSARNITINTSILPIQAAIIRSVCTCSTHVESFESVVTFNNNIYIYAHNKPVTRYQILVTN